MAEIPPDALRAALAPLTDPVSGKDLFAAGLIDSLETREGLVQLALRVPRERARDYEPLRAAAEKALAQVPGVKNATVILTAHRAGASPAAGPQGGAHTHAHAHAAPPPPQTLPKLLGEARAVIAVASGKGGVGKSTVAVNLAVALAQRGLSVGLLDADIYGPSLPQMLGVRRRPHVHDDRLVPIEAWGVAAMSIGFIVDPDTAMIWRGPMVMGALQQLMEQVAWGSRDVIVVDLPPGTGDAQLTLAQRVALAGAVVVSTPQDVALADARRGVAMFRKVGVEVLGLVENMSYFVCPHCGERTDIFGHGGARAEAERLKVRFLGEIPLLPQLRALADAGTPIVAAQPESEAAKAFARLAETVAASLKLEARAARQG